MLDRMQAGADKRHMSFEHDKLRQLVHARTTQLAPHCGNVGFVARSLNDLPGLARMNANCSGLVDGEDAS